MTGPAAEPLIVGASISGLFTSHRMAERGIKHQMVGLPPGDGPRLGESLDLPGSIATSTWFPSFADYFHPKLGIQLYLFDHCADVSGSLGRGTGLCLRALGYRRIRHVIHVDRVGFDRALFERVVSSPHCTHLEAQVEKLHYDPGTDRVDTVGLSTGDELRATVVVDGTGPRRMLAREIGLEYRTSTAPQRVVFTHCHAPRPLPPPVGGWRAATTIVRLHRAVDGFDGVVWCIPLGDYVSIGVSAEVTEIEHASSELVLDVACEALERSGVDCRQVYPDPKPPVSVSFTYGEYERGFGANWVLAGPAFASYWFPISTGVALAMGAADAAVGLVEGRADAGRAYETLARECYRAHRRVSYFFPPNGARTDRVESIERVKPLVRGNFVRAAVLAQIGDCGPAVRRLGRFLAHQVEKRQLGVVTASSRPTSRPRVASSQGAA